MKTKNIILIIILVLVLLFSIILWNAFKVKRHFVLLTSDKHDFCILVDNRYKHKYADGKLIYSGGENKGRIEILDQGLSQDMASVQIGDFEGGYKKYKNFRVYEYLLSDGVILRDTFEYAQKVPINLVPLRLDCEKIKNRFKIQETIFN